MGVGTVPALRSLPRSFVIGAPSTEEFDLPKEESQKLHKVLRLPAGAKIAVLPGNGSILLCEFRGRTAIPLEVHWPETEPKLFLRLVQALPKGDKLDEIVRSCTEAGVSEFAFFESERTVVRWDSTKLEAKLKRLETIATEAAEVSYRTRVPSFEMAASLGAALKSYPSALVLSEVEGVSKPLHRQDVAEMTLVVGPEGGWSKKELELIGDRAVGLGPRVLRVDHAGFAAASILLLGHLD